MPLNKPLSDDDFGLTGEDFAAALSRASLSWALRTPAISRRNPSGTFNWKPNCHSWNCPLASVS
jgi:hypothetical protein